MARLVPGARIVSLFGGVIILLFHWQGQIIGEAQSNKPAKLF